jgi:hypothetical protein
MIALRLTWLISLIKMPKAAAKSKSTGKVEKRRGKKGK